MTSFDEYRDRMLEIIGTAEKLLTADPPQNTDILDLCHARMSRIFTAYHLYADRELFTPCAGPADPAQRKRVREIAAECATLAGDFRTFTRRCTANPPVERWSDYRITAHALLVRIRRHLHTADVEVPRRAARAEASLADRPTRKAG